MTEDGKVREKERIERTLEAFRRNRYDVSLFQTKEEAADYLAREIAGKRVGFGDARRGRVGAFVRVQLDDLARRLLAGDVGGDAADVIV